MDQWALASRPCSSGGLIAGGGTRTTATTGATKAQETLDKINEKKGKKKAAKDEPAKEPAKDAPKEEASKEQAHKEEPKKEQERGDADDSPGDGKLFGGTGDDPSR